MEFRLIMQPAESIQLPGQYTAATVDLQQIDWTSEFALVVDMGEQRTGGYAVDLQQLHPGADTVQVQLAVRRPRPGGMLLQAFTHPWCLVRIPRAGLPPVVPVVVTDQNGHALARLEARLEEE